MGYIQVSIGFVGINNHTYSRGRKKRVTPVIQNLNYLHESENDCIIIKN